MIQGRASQCDTCPTFAVFDNGQPVKWEWHTTDGRGYQIYDYPFSDTDGSPLVLELGIDIIERIRAEEEVLKLNMALEERVAQRTAQLEASNRELEGFCYSISHDLRAPLARLQGFSQALSEDCSDCLNSDCLTYAERIGHASRQLQEAIDALLNLSRLTRIELQLEEVDLSGIACDIARELQEGQPERKAEFVIAPGVTTTGDERLLRVVLENLVGNAWKFTASRPCARIEFGSSGRQERREFFVRDNGAGFDMRYAGKLFREFHRLHAPAEFPGNGIGLASVRRIVERHGGRIRAEGEVGKGATFYFTL